MTVEQLIQHLQTLPQDSQIYFRGYSCGSVWHSEVSQQDFREETHLETGKTIVEIDAEWN